MTLTSCVISSNTASNVRFVANWNRYVTVHGPLEFYETAEIFRNRLLILGSQGGGVFIADGQVDFISCAITGNTAAHVSFGASLNRFVTVHGPKG